jgi:hypothetical protein
VLFHDGPLWPESAMVGHSERGIASGSIESSKPVAGFVTLAYDGPIETLAEPAIETVRNSSGVARKHNAS